jgi:aryl-alcohol dehydrogenase-like predicted oxidoreductase
MKTRQLGRTGLRVPVLCLGTMTFGLQCDRDTSFAILDRSLEGGLDFLDTADVYPLGGSLETVGRTEELIGEWMQSRGNRDRIVLATKCRGQMGRGANDAGLSRQHVLAACEASLRRLRTDRIDLYQTHFFDPDVRIEETLRALEDLVRAGKVRYVGCSNYPAWRLGEALMAARQMGVEGYVSVQPRYNLLYREIETELIPLCLAQGLGVLVYNPLAGGFLSGKHKRAAEPAEQGRFTLGAAGKMYRHRYWQEAQFAAVERLQKEVAARGLDLVSVAIAWVLAQPGITSAIIGASQPAQLASSLAGAALQLDDALKAACDEIWWELPRRPVAEGYR